ncbi:MAG: hypothetical protein M3Y86_07185 [Verrucomicrobiota bacterium]|nr:hypothetical protein [Verrucomicrobiota bacterium]
MKRTILISLLGLGCAFTRLHAAIDFTPVQGEREVEGVHFKQLLFYYPGGKVSYTQPMGWNYRGDSKGFSLTPPNLAQASASIEQLPPPPAAPSPEEAIKRLHDQAVASIPAGSTDVNVIAEEQSPLHIRKQESYGVTLSYKFYGVDYRTNLLFANLEDVQLRFRVVARASDFDKVFSAFRGSLFTMLWEPDPNAKLATAH